MREIYSELIDEAFSAGISDAWDFWHMTPAEVNGRLRANQAELERLDTLAWMMGRYTAYGVNAPKKYPRKPEMMKNRKPSREMDDDELMTMMTAFAETHNAIEESK